MRDDSLGFFWEDLQARAGRNAYARPIPPVPDTRWVAPAKFPRLAGAPVVALDTETKDTELTTKGPGFRREGDEGAHIVGIACGTPDGGRWYFPMRHTIAPEQNLDPGHVLAWAKDNLCTPGQTKVGANLMYDVDALWSEGVPVTGPFIDVQFAEALLDENRFSYSLENLLQDYFGMGKVKDDLRNWVERAYGEDENYRANIWRAPPCLVGPYAEGDVDGPLRLWAEQEKKLAAEDLTELFQLETGLIEPLVHMRQRGVRIDLEYARRLDDELTSAIDTLDARIAAVAGRPISTTAAGDLVRLFDAAGVAYPRTPTGKPSFAKEFLERCGHPVALLVVERRKLAKYRDTFVRGYVLDLNVNGRLHALFHPLKGDENGTVSGRFSSSLPNLQNIPARDPVWGPKLRALFIPEDGQLWGRHDWSQIEYRFLAHYARGPSGAVVRRMYNENPDTDFHEMTLDMVAPAAQWDVSTPELRKQRRKPVKNINFGLCIAQGQRVLTDRGPVPIENVSASDLLWDGVDWATHAGVVCNGDAEVITHDGLTATQDHIVWTRDGRQIPFGVAASEGIRLARTGTEDGRPTFAGDAPGCTWDVPARANDPHAATTVHELRKTKEGEPRQLQDVQELPVPEGQVQRPTCRDVGGALRCHDPALPAYIARERQALPGAGHQSVVQVAGALYPVGAGEVAGADVQGVGLRSPGQRWPLQPAKPAPRDTSSQPSKQTATVFDIVNAGPRSRFTCEGVLVHNCYGMGQTKLATDLGLDARDGADLFRSYHTAVPFVKATYDSVSTKARDRGWIKTVSNRRARFPLWEPRFGRRDGEDKAMPYEKAVDAYDGRIVRAFTHKALNRLLQGSAADLMKRAMYDMWKAGLHNELGHMLLTCHDETGHSVPQTPAGRQAFEEVRHIMETCMVLRVPIRADQSTGANWGACQ